MFKKLSILLACVALFSCNKKDERVVFIHSVSNNVILTGYQKLQKSSALLYDESLACEASTNYSAVLEKIKPQWRQAMSDWQRIQWVQFGPIKEGSREWALQFWPDRKNLVGRKTNALLKQDEVVTEQQLASSSVLVQGLSALEFLLFDETLNNNADGSKKHCLLVKEIANKLRITTKGLTEDWKVFHKINFSQLKKPLVATDAATPKITTIEQGIDLIISNIVVQLDKTVDQKLGTPFAINKTIDKSNGYFLESWRSESSRENINDNIIAIRSLLNEGGLKQYLHKKGLNQLANKLEEEINVTIELLNKEMVTLPDKGTNSYFKLLSEDKKSAVDSIQPLLNQLAKLRVLVKTDLTKALGVKLGFNSNDGDS